MTARVSIVAAAALLAAACGSMRQQEPPPKPFAGTRWQVVLELPPQGEQPNIRMGDGRLEGFGGCNRINAGYLQDAVGARAIAFTGISASKRMCDGTAMATEARLLEMLRTVSSYQIVGDEMVMSGSGGSMRLRAAPEVLK